MTRPSFQYFYNEDDEANLTVHFPGRTPAMLTAHVSHPYFEKAVAELMSTSPDLDKVYDYMQPVRMLAREFTQLSERVSFAYGTIFFDGDEVESDALTKQIIRHIDEETEDWKPLVNFFEKVMDNPNEHSRRQLYAWIDAQPTLTITKDGDMVAYKGVRSDDNGGFVSGYQGRAIVDGVVHEGRIPNSVGSTVTMPRSEVHHDPNASCSTGLHIGTFGYAQDYAKGATLEVHVNPRDVVSVPNDGRGEKARVCRYYVKQVITDPHTTLVREDDEPVVEDDVHVRPPSPTEFVHMLGRAKRRRRNPQKYIEKHTDWKYVGGPDDDPKVRENWVA